MVVMNRVLLSLVMVLFVNEVRKFTLSISYYDITYSPS